ncbi:MAG: DUF2167 domain-containing protein [Saprospiraceae bacterium]|nr:DUF2167 domain-containing protein [Saprospiraceae bacterium]
MVYNLLRRDGYVKDDDANDIDYDDLLKDQQKSILEEK